MRRFFYALRAYVREHREKKAKAPKAEKPKREKPKSKRRKKMDKKELKEKMNRWRHAIFTVIEVGKDTKASKAYDYAMLFFIILSLVPLAFREQTTFLKCLDLISVSVFIIDYILRWITADIKRPNLKGRRAFLMYPLTPMAIIDFLSIIPSFTLFHRVFKLFRLPRLLKILRVVRFARYSKNLRILFKVVYKERHILFTVFLLAVAYIVTTALIMFNLEESVMFQNYFDALYWATTTLTTVGYGDICPSTDLGRVISMFSAVFGVAVIALPSGVITASYLEELREAKNKKDE